VLEIGPGLGALTQLLLAKVPNVLAIEKDKRLVQVLQQRWGANPRLQLLHADALEYLRQTTAAWSGWKLVSNLPYSVGSPILVELAKSEHPPISMVVTLQLEVAERLAAAAGDADYGVLSLLVQLRYRPAGMFKIPASCFFPAPDVDSACVTLLRRTTPLLERALGPVFEKIVKRGFSQRRKMLMKLLKADWPLADLTNAFTKLGLSEQARAETISLEQYVQLTQILSAANQNS
jgi:16S rRNA (adenine1518-N6/adenine1519-N6)-dimethyltransferase